MAWADLATNQTISFDNLKNAVANSVFTPKTTIPVGNEQITKTDANTYVNIDTAWASYAAKANNQLVVQQDLKPPPGVTQTQTPSNSPTPSYTPTPTQTPRPSCPDRRVVIQVCNSNSQIDDNFDVYLNGTYIGALNLNQNAQIGSIFLGDSNTSVNVTQPDFTCPLSNMVTYRFANNTVIRGGNNVLFMDNTQNNGNGNFGTVEIRNYLLVGNDLEQPCGVANLTFNGSSGSDFTFNFQYDECCAFTITPTPTKTPTQTPTPTNSVYDVTISAYVPATMTCAQDYYFGASANYNLDTDVTVYTTWYGDLGGFVSSYATILTGDFCGAGPTFNTGFNIYCLGEFYSSDNTTLSLYSYGNQNYIVGSTVSSGLYPC